MRISQVLVIPNFIASHKQRVRAKQSRAEPLTPFLQLLLGGDLAVMNAFPGQASKFFELRSPCTPYSAFFTTYSVNGIP